ncbi:MAG TPA: hypothetical protein PLH16_03655 [Candidatus Omnitrophota bacterium]|jgi:hypothetical protein|nr:hypothetical protein [Candidatus Omnitrophota bacterium]
MMKDIALKNTGIVLIVLMCMPLLALAEQPGRLTAGEQGSANTPTVPATTAKSVKERVIPVNDYHGPLIQIGAREPVIRTLTSEEAALALSFKLYAEGVCGREDMSVFNVVIKQYLDRTGASVRMSGAGDFVFENELAGMNPGTASGNSVQWDVIVDQKTKYFFSNLKEYVEQTQGGASGGNTSSDKLARSFNNLINSAGFTTYVSPGSAKTDAITETAVWAVRTLANMTAETAAEVGERFEDDATDRAREVTSALDRWLEADPGKTAPDVSNDDSCTVLASVSLDEKLAAMHVLMNPSRQLHPFLRWYLNKRYMTEERVKAYEEAQARVITIYRMAKEGKGLIRYKGKIGPAYLPFMNEKGGSYELVRMNGSATPK